jgi:hypothetical protein
MLLVQNKKTRIQGRQKQGRTCSHDHLGFTANRDPPKNRLPNRGRQGTMVQRHPASGKRLPNGPVQMAAKATSGASKNACRPWFRHSRTSSRYKRVLPLPSPREPSRT